MVQIHKHTRRWSIYLSILGDGSDTKVYYEMVQILRYTRRWSRYLSILEDGPDTKIY